MDFSFDIFPSKYFRSTDCFFIYLVVVALAISTSDRGVHGRVLAIVVITDRELSKEYTI